MSLLMRLSIPNEKEDRISDLPDSLLYHIISFLPTTKDVVVTSLLSKRWKPLWLSQLVINLDEEDALTFRQLFGSFTPALPILSLHLKWHPHHQIVVYAAIQRGLQNLTIKRSHYGFLTEKLKLSSFSQTIKPLIFLKLKNLTINKLSRVEFPSLKGLHIKSITFPYYKYLTKLLSGCPILEYLETNDLIVNKMYFVVMGDSKNRSCLSNLVRANISGAHIFLSQLYNTHHLRLHVVCINIFLCLLHNLYILPN